MTMTSTAFDLISSSVIFIASSPLVGWLTSSVSRVMPSFFAQLGSSACSASINAATPPAQLQQRIDQGDGEAERHRELKEVADGRVIQRDCSKNQAQGAENDGRPGRERGRATQRGGSTEVGAIGGGDRDAARFGDGRARRDEQPGPIWLSGVQHIDARRNSGRDQPAPEEVQRQILHLAPRPRSSRCDRLGRAGVLGLAGFRLFCRLSRFLRQLLQYRLAIGRGGPAEVQAPEGLGPGHRTTVRRLLALPQPLEPLLARARSDLARVAAQRIDFLAELRANIDEIVGFVRAGQQHRVHLVRLQPGGFVLREIVRVAREREDGVQSHEADGAMVAVVEAAITVPGDQDMRPDLADGAHQKLAQLRPVLHEAVRHAQKNAAVDTKLARGSLLLCFPQGGEVMRRQGLVLRALVAAGDEAKNDLPAVLGQRRGRAAAGELDVIGVGHHDQDPLGVHRVWRLIRGVARHGSHSVTNRGLWLDMQRIEGPER